MRTLLRSYLNGNTNVEIYSDGTKIRSYEGEPRPLYPESMDCKITNYCDNPLCAKWCHEMSNTSGKHADLVLGLKLLEDFPSGCELAIGGGNPLSHPGLCAFTKELSSRGVICNLTVNSYHVKSHRGQLFELIDKQYIKGVGISYFRRYIEDCDVVVSDTPNAVFHLILGVHTVDDLKLIAERYSNPKVLLLGYKQYGNGSTYFNPKVEQALYKWYTEIFAFFNIAGLTLSFDNLAIQQLNLKRFFPQKEWDKFYMGDDGTFTMFLDLVERKYTTSSTSSRRFNLVEDDTVQKIFTKIKQ